MDISYAESVPFDMTEKDPITMIEEALEAGRPGSKRRLKRIRLIHKDLRVAFFALNTGAALAFSGIYASLAANPETTIPGYLLIAVISFSMGALLFVASLVLEAALLSKRLWSDTTDCTDKVLSYLDRVVLYAPSGEWVCLVVGVIAIAFGFVEKLV